MEEDSQGKREIMKELNVSPEELKNIIENGRILGKGFFGTVFTYQDKLIKLDNTLYNLLKINDKTLSRNIVEDFYRFDDRCVDFNNRSQLEYLASKQKDIKLTKLPEGIVTLKDVSPRITGISPGIIIPYHKNHQKLELLSKKDYQKVLIILRKLLLAVKELADNKISHEDLRSRNKKEEYNVLYKGDTPQIIDLSGDLIAEGDDFINAREMYIGLGEIIFNFMKDDYITSKMPKLTTYEENREFLNEFSERIKR